ncbi:hypothetical protein HK100_010171 [Physocladia obscura]|uniref:Uncharacterized protein n=1 Tax=Physocladia obscura TaxID=109957 RepID=A0AAD5XIZ4_9FUNG|nr:hypothetical protein HK100_010171 [Physocladia obscura]
MFVVFRNQARAAQATRRLIQLQISTTGEAEAVPQNCKNNCNSKVRIITNLTTTRTFSSLHAHCARARPRITTATTTTTAELLDAESSTPSSHAPTIDVETQRLKNAIAEDIMATLFDNKKTSNNNVIMGKQKIGTPVAETLSYLPSKENQQEVDVNYFKVSVDPVGVVDEMKSVDTAVDSMKTAELKATIAEKLRLRREARGRAKEMIGDLSEMAEYFRAKEEQVGSVVAGSNDDVTVVVDGTKIPGIYEANAGGDKSDDWFVGKSFKVSGNGAVQEQVVAGGGISRLETVNVVEQEKKEVLHEGKETDHEDADDLFIPRWMKAATKSESRKIGLENDLVVTHPEGILTAEEIVESLKAERGQKIMVLDVSRKCEWTDTMVIVEGRSKKQIFSLVDGVRRLAKKYVTTDSSLASTMAIEGAQTEDWMVLDLGRTVVHAMSPDARKFYDLEGLWQGMEETESTPLEAFANTNEDAELLQMVEQAWKGRPTTLVKTKQLEVEDFLEEVQVRERLESHSKKGLQVFGRR